MAVLGPDFCGPPQVGDTFASAGPGIMSSLGGLVGSLGKIGGAAGSIGGMFGGGGGQQSQPSVAMSSATSGGDFGTGIFGKSKTALYLAGGVLLVWFILRKK